MTRSEQFIVYRDELLAGSETFILGQSESLPHFPALLCGLAQAAGIELAGKARAHYQ